MAGRDTSGVTEVTVIDERAQAADGARRTPSRAQLQAAYGATVPDLVGPGMRVLLVGINPSLWSGWAGTHFARPGNRLWRTLHEAGFTDRVLHPSQTEAVLASGLGVTNLVARATARAEELTDAELRAGVAPLHRLVRRWRPPYLAFLGVGAYRVAYGVRRAVVGPREETVDGARVWVLPNPSGLNAHYQQPALTAAYRALHDAVAAGGPVPARHTSGDRQAQRNSR